MTSSQPPAPGQSNQPGPRRLSTADRIWAKAWLALRRVRKYLRLNHSAQRLRGQRAALQEQYQARRSKDEPCFVFAPGLSWTRQLFQRPQQLALALGREGALVYYLEPEPDLNEPTLAQVAEGVWLVNAPAAALDFLPAPMLYLLSWSDSPADSLTTPRLLYDIVDDFSTFQVNQRLVRYQHHQRMQQAVYVLVTARRLLSAFQAERADLILCPNGVDYLHFHGHAQPLPADVQPLLTGCPVVGYYGALAEWVDYPLLIELAQLRLDVLFLLIGPAHDHSLERSGLLRLPNVHWLGVKPYDALPAYLQAFDVAMIPFRITPITNATSPIKLFEYLAGGKPVISTPITECLGLQGVFTAADAREFSAQIDAALEIKHDPVYQAQIDTFARENTWDARARQILEALSRAAML